MPSLVLLGRDHVSYGEVEIASLEAGAAVALSVGADPTSPSLRFKADAAVPNEDALAVVTVGDRALLTVADAHFGHEASHDLVAEVVRRAKDGIPESPLDLEDFMTSVAEMRPGHPYRSETTLNVLVHDRGAGAGFGVSFGDSTAALLAPGRGLSILHRTKPVYVSPLVPASWSAVHACRYRFETTPGQWLLAFTDGIDECHYRHPETSLTPERIAAVVESAEPSPEGIAEALTRAALAGIAPHPGGQDNIALIVWRT